MFTDGLAAPSLAWPNACGRPNGASGGEHPTQAAGLRGRRVRFQSDLSTFAAAARFQRVAPKCGDGGAHRPSRNRTVFTSSKHPRPVPAAQGRSAGRRRRASVRCQGALPAFASAARLRSVAPKRGYGSAYFPPCRRALFTSSRRLRPVPAAQGRSTDRRRRASVCCQGALSTFAAAVRLRPVAPKRGYGSAHRPPRNRTLFTSSKHSRPRTTAPG